MAAGFAPNDFDRRLSDYKQHKYKRETKVEIDQEVCWNVDSNRIILKDQKSPTIGRKMKEYGRKKRKIRIISMWKRKYSAIEREFRSEQIADLFKIKKTIEWLILFAK